MREPVIERFPKAPGPPRNIDAYLKRVNDAYVTDAYHSLSIEGYRVAPGLIERVRGGRRNPEADQGDHEQRNAMAARGYWQAFQVVQKSLGKILKGKNPGEVADADHGTWYRELFAPSVTIGLRKPADLAGYRNGQVYIRKSMHVPLNRDAVRDAMPAFFDLLREEPHPAVRVVLGHFIFVYIHPYMDGNGRVGRFLMNTMMASGGYPVDGHSGNRPQRLRERSRKSECRREYRALRGLSRRAGEETAGGRALAGSAESFARRRTLEQFSICRE
jgi:Fic/DOC family